MSFPANSRYAATPVATVTLEDGREVRYVTRRILPAPESLAQVREHEVHSSDRIDLIAAQHLGDSGQYWQICDANLADAPSDLTEEAGRRLRITLPAGVPIAKPSEG